MTLEFAMLLGNIMLRFGPKVADAYKAAVKSGEDKDWQTTFTLAEKPWEDGVVGPDGLVH